MSIFRRVGAGSGRVDFNGASSSRGLAHAIAEASARHSIAVYGHPGQHPVVESSREGGSSLNSILDLNAVETAVLAYIKIRLEQEGARPSVEEVAEARRSIEARYRDRLGDEHEAVTPLQKALRRSLAGVPT